MSCMCNATWYGYSRGECTCNQTCYGDSTMDEKQCCKKNGFLTSVKDNVKRFMLWIFGGAGDCNCLGSTKEKEKK
jgi:hypothetical protein